MWFLFAIIFIAMTVNHERERNLNPNTPPSSILPSAPRPAPDLADDRNVTEQDCSKPVDLSSGNLRCK